MFYRVQCVDRATGDQTERLYHAPNPEAAAKMAMADGFVVGGVRPDVTAARQAAASGVPEALGGPVTGADRLSTYMRLRRRPTGFGPFFRFEMFVMPRLIRLEFAAITVLAGLVTLAAPVLWLVLDKERSSAGALIALGAIAVTWVLWFGLRLLAEVYIIFFSIHERLVDIAENTAPRG